MKQQIPRVLLAGTSSGSGKTTVVCAVLQALVQRGRKVAAFKCGPDYIDPMFHSRIIGAKSANLDQFFFSDNTTRYLLCRNAESCDLSVIEGVMGFYDGMGLTETKASSYDLARVTDTPVVLVVNARGASLSVLATIHGFLGLFPDNHIRGVILNQCTATTYAALADVIRSRFEGRLVPLGYLPSMKDCTLESRHLGLVTAAEISDLREKLSRLAQQAEQSIDLDGLVALAERAPAVVCDPIALPRYAERVRIAVARDKAFCFYYEDSLEMLRDMGAELIPFSPLEGQNLPEDIHGLYLGGGYPELYARELSENIAMRSAIHTALTDALPCIAECGGFMYLTQSIDGWPMVGYLPGSCYDTGRLTRFGYVTLRARTDNLLCKAGETIAGHEFHHWDCTEPGDSFAATKSTGKTWACTAATDRLYAGFPHFHFYANPAFAKGFYDTCLKEKHRND